MKILYLILSAPYRPWTDLFENGISKTWVQDVQREQNDYVFLSIGSPLPLGFHSVINRFLQSQYGTKFWSSKILPARDVTVERNFVMRSARYDRWDTMFGKFIDCANYAILNSDFDYLVRVNTTTHVNSANLRRSLMSKNVKYGGYRIKSEDCAAGWAMVFSREFLKSLVKFDFTRLELKGRYEDGVICQVAKQLKVEFTEFSFEFWEGEKSYSDVNRLSSVPFVRVKQSVGHRRIDDISHRRMWELMTRVSEE